MNSKKILFRVDGDKKLGMGHIYRVRNLAEALKKQKHQLVFVTKTPIATTFLNKFGNCLVIKNDDSKKLKDLLITFNPDIILIDKLKENNFLLQIFKKYCNKIIAIDYTGKNTKNLDIGINILYQKTGFKSRPNYSGFQFTILDEKFHKTNSIKINKKIQSILILQGGSDTHCFIPKILDALNSLDEKINLKIVIGPAFKCWNKLESSLKSNSKKIKIYHNAKNMAAIMHKTDLAISAGGVTLLELCRMGIPTIVVCGETFENETATILQKQGFGINLGFGKQLSEQIILNSTNELISNYKLRVSMNKASKSIIDDLGSNRVIDLLDISN